MLKKISIARIMFPKYVKEKNNFIVNLYSVKCLLVFHFCIKYTVSVMFHGKFTVCMLKNHDYIFCKIVVTVLL